MRISNFRQQVESGYATVTASVEWEESDRPSREIFFQTDETFGRDLEPDPNAFFAAAYLAAIRHGERRLWIEGSVCPVLNDGLAEASAILDVWHRRPRRRIVVEASRGFLAPWPVRPPRSAGFLSGGVDSAFLFHSNRLDFPSGHLERFGDAIFIAGRDFPGEETSSQVRAYAGRVRRRLAAMTADVGAELIVVTSNVRQFEPDLDFFAREWFAATAVSCAIVLSRRISSIRIGSGATVSRLGPWGTHPLLDRCYSTAALSVFHEGIQFTRFQKVLALTAWPAAIRNLVVCNYQPVDPWVNCGICEKCVATMLELTAAGVLSQTESFPFREVTSEMISKVPHCSGAVHIWSFLREQMRVSGRRELAGAIASLLRRTRARDILRRVKRVLH